MTEMTPVMPFEAVARILLEKLDIRPASAETAVVDALLGGAERYPLVVPTAPNWRLAVLGPLVEEPVPEMRFRPVLVQVRTCQERIPFPRRDVPLDEWMPYIARGTLWLAKRYDVLRGRYAWPKTPAGQNLGDMLIGAVHALDRQRLSMAMTARIVARQWGR